MQLSGPRNKASREKLRRERLNDRFAQLAQLIDPGKPPKTDKATILTDAARVVSGLRSEGRELRHTNQQLMEELRKLRMQLQLMGGGVGMASPDLQCTRMAEGDCQYIPVMHGAGGGRSMHYAGTGRQVPPPRHGDNLTGPTEVGSWDGGGGSVCGPLPQDPRLMAPVGGGQGPPAHQDYNGGQQLGGFPPASAGGVRLERTYSADFMDSISGDDPFSDNKQVRVKMDESWKGGVGGELSG
mmetsp:Transcript_6313/g.21729  ORF Transcript_6313/g.21729 Transcript_6313/m.21729 type:complete len:241 (+) Transcript_6313:190-912(+)